MTTWEDIKHIKKPFKHTCSHCGDNDRHIIRIGLCNKCHKLENPIIWINTSFIYWKCGCQRFRNLKTRNWWPCDKH